jgi:hypothetical protein
VVAAQRAGRVARVHLKVDTGLSRNGAPLADWPDLRTAVPKRWPRRPAGSPGGTCRCRTTAASSRHWSWPSRRFREVGHGFVHCDESTAQRGRKGPIMADGFRVDLPALLEATQGVVGTLKAVQVRKVSDIDADKSAFGHDGLGGTVENFCTRWELGVENLVKDGQEVADRLVRSVVAYVKVDTAGQHRMEKILSGSGPDPAGG